MNSWPARNLIWDNAPRLLSALAGFSFTAVLLELLMASFLSTGGILLWSGMVGITNALVTARRPRVESYSLLIRLLEGIGAMIYCAFVVGMAGASWLVVRVGDWPMLAAGAGYSLGVICGLALGIAVSLAWVSSKQHLPPLLNDVAHGVAMNCIATVMLYITFGIFIARTFAAPEFYLPDLFTWTIVVLVNGTIGGAILLLFRHWEPSQDT